MSLLCAFRASGISTARGGLLRPTGSLPLLQVSLNSRRPIGLQRLCIKPTPTTLSITARLGQTAMRLEFSRTIHSTTLKKNQTALHVNNSSSSSKSSSRSKEVVEVEPRNKIDDRIKHPMYDMPLKKTIRRLRIFFLFNFTLSAGLAVWASQDDIYSVFAAIAIGVAGFMPMAVFQIFYRTHVRSIRILGNLSKQQLRIMRSPGKYGNSQVVYPVLINTPLSIQKFSLTSTDPVFNIYARDLQPGPTRRFSVSWHYKPPQGRIQKFRVSTKILQFHPDIKALDKLIRSNKRWKNLKPDVFSIVEMDRRLGMLIDRLKDIYNHIKHRASEKLKNLF